jgi:hypothetical protein
LVLETFLHFVLETWKRSRSRNLFQKGFEPSTKTLSSFTRIDSFWRGNLRASASLIRVKP